MENIEMKKRVLKTIILSKNSTHEQRLRAISLFNEIDRDECSIAVNQSNLSRCTEKDFLYYFNIWRGNK